MKAVGACSSRAASRFPKQMHLVYHEQTLNHYHSEYFVNPYEFMLNHYQLLLKGLWVPCFHNGCRSAPPSSKTGFASHWVDYKRLGKHSLGGNVTNF